MPLWHVYLIECADGSLYTGITTDVARRFAQHQAGKGARYTRSHPPVRLVGSRVCKSKSDALKVEMVIKKLPKTAKAAALRADVEPMAQATAATAAPLIDH